MKILLSLGSSIGDRKKYIETAIELIQQVEIKVLKQSSFYETAPVGGIAENLFINIALLVETNLSLQEVLFLCKSIEFDLGRRKRQTWADREIDIDILLYEKEFQNKFLEVPHPYFHQRKFALVPAAEIAPNMLHQTLNKTVAELLEECTDTNNIFLMEDN